MANRRFEMHEIRNILIRMRLGERDRQIARAGLMGRTKATELRQLALEQGWLDNDILLPANDVLAEIVRGPAKTKAQSSLVAPYADEVLAWAKRGITGVAIHQILVRNYGFTLVHSGRPIADKHLAQFVTTRHKHPGHRAAIAIRLDGLNLDSLIGHQGLCERLGLLAKGLYRTGGFWLFAG